MKSINIIFTYKSIDEYPQKKLDSEYLKKIREVSKKIKITTVDISQAESGDNKTKQQLDSLLADVEIIFGHRLPNNLVARAPKLKWIQAMSAGVEMLLTDELRESSIHLTNMRGVASTPIAEAVLTFILMFVRKMLTCMELKKLKQWQHFHPELLNSKTVGIVGLGNIGSEVARLVKCFGARVVATNKPAKPSKYADSVYNTKQLSKLLSESDFVVLTVPLTSETQGMIGEKQLDIMKPSAYLINVSRGKVIDEDALIKALKNQRIAGAGLDVFQQEPLPADSPLWELPNVIISPHIAAYIKDYDRLATEVFCDNLRRYLSGKKLRNPVNKKLGY